MVPNASFVATEDRRAQPRKSLLSQKTTYGQEKLIGTIPARLKRLGDSQSELDEVHVDLLEMKSGEKEVTCRDKRRGQVWFSKELWDLRKEIHRREKVWLKTKLEMKGKVSIFEGRKVAK